MYFTNQDKWMELRSGNVKKNSKVFREEVFKKTNSNDMWLRHWSERGRNMGKYAGNIGERKFGVS